MQQFCQSFGSHLAVIVAAILAVILDLAIKTASDQINSASIEFLDPINLHKIITLEHLEPSKTSKNCSLGHIRE